ncbi:MAG: hypothetical protein Q9219_007628, partial [cf. Caloplaca sp. 3 TL-2023]
MPHATESLDVEDAQDAQDDLLIRQVLDPENSFDISRDLEPGEKADNAVDYEDLSDDDLADDEDVSKTNLPQPRNQGSFHVSLPNLTNNDDHLAIDNTAAVEDDFDDLFGDKPQSPENDVGTVHDRSVVGPLPCLDSLESEEANPRDEYVQEPLGHRPAQYYKTQSPRPRSLQALNMQTVSKEEQMQQYLISMSTHGTATHGDHPGMSRDEGPIQDLATLWPKFQRHSVPRFMDLLPLKRSHFTGKLPSKQPKPVFPNKLNLDLAPDHERQFRLPSGPRKGLDTTDEQDSILRIPPSSITEAGAEDSPLLSDSDNETFGGATWQDLQIVCEDWDNWSPPASASSKSSPISERPSKRLAQDEEDQAGSDYYRPLLSAKASARRVSILYVLNLQQRRKTSHNDWDLPRSHQIALPALSDPVYTTSKVAKSIVLDLNDPRILIEKTSHLDYPRNCGGISDTKLRRPLIQRYNISNDEAYDLLKENHQSKIRSNLGNPHVEHSLPAIRLQWPYVSLNLYQSLLEADVTKYKTKLEKQEARSFHRPVMSFHRNEKILFHRPRHIKRKHLKGKDTHTMYGNTHDLSLGDNSSLLLLEYSEEFPTIMSNFGMGSRIINYYRRKSPEDNSRPKLEVGETNLLMPQDKSPFSIFGHIDPGELAPALYNGMYKAPLFIQEPKIHDFVVVRNTTGVQGPSWYLRNIEHIRVVGQEFPSVDVPGPHSRKVTTAAKNRLKMISYRLLRKSKTHKIKVSAVTRHFTDSTDMQNRQKMKEFMQFDKTGKEWEMRSGEAIPDEESIRTMVKPEDVCLLESMQVGQRHLQDAGFGKGDDDAEGDAANQGRGIEQLLAPWFTSRNFLNAVQGKAMLELHGEGDPSGRGEAFSFIKTSMKGGFKAMGESVEDRLDAKKMKELGGHSYNVARQQRSYEESIRRIWDAQKQSLSSTQEHSDTDRDDGIIDEEEDIQSGFRTPHSETPTPASLRRKDDETMSQFSRYSSGSQAGKVLQITRRYRHQDGSVEKDYETIRNTRVIRQYLKRRNERELAKVKLNEARPTGDVEQDRILLQAVGGELARLERNKDRRIAREKQKGQYNSDFANSPGSPATVTPAPSKIVGTQRKCANCGQVGHIKTNK